MDELDSANLESIIQRIDSLQASDSLPAQTLELIKGMAADVKELKDASVLVSPDETATTDQDVYTTLVEVQDTVNALPTFEAVQITALGLIAGLMCFICFRLATHSWGRHG